MGDTYCRIGDKGGGFESMTGAAFSRGSLFGVQKSNGQELLLQEIPGTGTSYAMHIIQGQGGVKQGSMSKGSVHPCSVNEQGNREH